MTDLAHALAFLPHGPEFRFIDRLHTLTPGKEGSADYNVRGDESFLRGHFPDQPLFPGVLLIEAAAQLAGVVAQSDPALSPLPGLKLTAVRNAKILGSARPKETISLEAVISGRFENLVQASVTAEVNGKRILETTITLSGDRRE